MKRGTKNRPPQSEMGSPRRRGLKRCWWVGGVFWVMVGCSPLIDYQGHRIFNPLFLFYLESPWRDQWQRPDAVLTALQVTEGMAVADIGAGGGYFTERFSRRVGPQGVVFATDVQPVMLQTLSRRVQCKGLNNVTVVQGEFDDPKLPIGCCDLVFFSSVYKEIENRPAYMRKVLPLLKPGGRVVILEYRPEVEAPGPPKDFRLTDATIIAELESAGFRLVERFDFLPREYFLVFAPL